MEEYINVMTERYEKELLELQLKSEYIEKLQSIKKQKGFHFKSVKKLKGIKTNDLILVRQVT